MTDDSASNPEDFATLLAELSEMKALFKEGLGRLSEVERRVTKLMVKPKSPGRTKAAPKGSAKAPPLDEDGAEQLFEGFIERMGRGEGESVQTELGGLSAADLKMVVRALGVPVGAKATKDQLVRAVLGRLTESRLISG